MVMNTFQVTVNFIDNAYWLVTIRASPLIAGIVRAVVEVIEARCECHNVSCQCIHAAECNCPCYSYEVLEEDREMN